METSVVNIETGEIWVYNLPPMEAVRNAFFQSRGKHNTSAYPPAETLVKVGEDGKTVYAGDFVAINKKG